VRVRDLPHGQHRRGDIGNADALAVVLGALAALIKK